MSAFFGPNQTLGGYRPANQLPGYHDLKNNDPASIEESRRLLHFAMTWAKDRLVMTYCGTRDGKPSGGTMFLQEMGWDTFRK